MEGTRRATADRLEIPPLERSRGRTLIFVVVATLAIVALGAYLILRGPEQSPYRGDNVTRMSIVKEIRVTGHVQLIDEMEVPAPIDGQLVEVFVRPGEEVEEGQLLGQLDKVSAEVAFLVAEAELQVARARVAEAEAGWQRAVRALERTERLSNKGLASRSALETASSEMAKARAALRAAKAERAAAVEKASLKGRERDRTDIVAPRAGLVLEVPTRTGMMVGPQTKLFRIGASPDEIHVAAPIGEADVGAIEVGLSAKFEVPTYPGRVFEATVEHVNPDPKSEYGAIFYTVTLGARNPEHLLLPGMTTQVRIEVAQVNDALAVREASLRYTPRGAPPAPPRTRVWRLRDQALEEVAVEAGLSDGAHTEVRPLDPEALEEGDLVVIGLAVDGEGGAAEPSLSLRGDR